MSIEELKGQTIKKISTNVEGDEMIFHTETKDYKMYHQQNCCEAVWLDSVVGELDDLLNTPVLLAEERCSNDQNYSAPDMILHLAKGKNDDSWTWTFYTIRTIKGTVDIRWYGSSNGYYSEGVNFEEIKQ